MLEIKLQVITVVNQGGFKTEVEVLKIYNLDQYQWCLSISIIFFQYINVDD